MRSLKVLALLAFVAVILGSCARGISTYEAANGKAKCGRHLR